VAGLNAGYRDEFLEPNHGGSTRGHYCMRVYYSSLFQKRPKGLFPQKRRAAEWDTSYEVFFGRRNFLQAHTAICCDLIGRDNLASAANLFLPADSALYVSYLHDYAAG